MNEDPRCCGSGTCIIDTDGLCWCGQKWDAQKWDVQKMGHAPLVPAAGVGPSYAAKLPQPATGSDA